MKFKEFAQSHAIKALEISIDIARPFTEIKRSLPEAPDIDTQELARKAALIIETDPVRSLFAGLVMKELNDDRLTPEKADYLLTPPEER